jgi:DNA segregation ATPase FtsK/SpoIIIE-like protein
MSKTITIDGGDLAFMDKIRERMVSAATELIEQNYTLILRDLGRAMTEDENGHGELPVTVALKMASQGRKIFIDASIEWKRTKKTGDSLDPIIMDPDQKELNLTPTTGNGEIDENLIEQSISIIKETQRASVSSIQRRLRIGYTLAARIMDTLEERGLVGPQRGSDPRAIFL